MQTSNERPYNTKNLKVLLLEDYSLDAKLMTKAISTEHPNWEFLHVKDKAGFEDALVNELPDIILSDYSLPQYTGMQAFLTVKELGLEIPFILVTGELPEDEAVSCIKEGVDDYVIKSSLTRLNTAIDKALSKRKEEFQRRKIALELQNSEAQLRTIFNKAGVAICEFEFTNIFDIIDNRKMWQKANFKQVKELLKGAVISEANEDALKLFSAKDKSEIADSFAEFWCSDDMSPLRYTAQQISKQTDSFEEKAHFTTIDGASIFLKFTFNLINKTKGRYIVSFVDLTDVRRSEAKLTNVIERMESVVQSRTEELNNLNDELQAQARDRELINGMLRENYINMTESIIAAKRIQQLMLPPKQVIADSFSDVFIYLRPLHIVSGDFYWFYQKGSKCWIAAVDCTGHGVPGAFMSMIGSNVLNQAVMESQTESTSEILEKIDDLVIRELRQHEQGTEVSTGMDISLCSFDYSKMEMRYSGAFHQLYMMRDNELKTFRGDRFSLGGTFKHKGKSFGEHIIPIQRDDRIYMTTDGFLDQFGGPRNKKFTRKRFMELISNAQGKTMYDQEMEIKSALQDWKGAYEQIDDILVIGIQI